MPPTETPDQIARTRTVSAGAILENRADLRTYPYRHLAVVAQQRGFTRDQVTQAVAAVEVLHQYGWELVTVSEFTTSGIVYAFLRRR